MAETTGHRTAIVVGNAKYLHAPPLPNAALDARAMATKLKSFGFVVHETIDATKKDLEQLLETAGSILSQKRGVGLFYYAGHGVQIDWHNYVLPVEVSPESSQDLIRQSVDVQNVIQRFRSADNTACIVILDACRDNPFQKTPGLAPMNAPSGTFLAYATAPGNVAEDGSPEDGNGLFTRHLLQEISQTGISIEDLFKRVRVKVRRASNGRQIPWEMSSLEEPFAFLGSADVTLSTSAREREFIAEKAEWDRIKSLMEPEQFLSFLEKYPSGTFSELAQYRLDFLQRNHVIAAPGNSDPRVLQSGKRRYEVGDEFTYTVIDRTYALGKESTIAVRVTNATDDVVQFSDGSVSDQMGTKMGSPSKRMDPGDLEVPADIWIGKKWRSAFVNWYNGIRETKYIDSEVVALEEIAIPAGNFRAYKVLRNGFVVSTGYRSQGEHTVWIDPGSMHVIKSQVKYWSNSRAAPGYFYEVIPKARRLAPRS